MVGGEYVGISGEHDLLSPYVLLGASLLYPWGAIRHAGIVMGACRAVRRQMFEEPGGIDARERLNERWGKGLTTGEREDVSLRADELERSPRRLCSLR
jgi:hypothetical protein